MAARPAMSARSAGFFWQGVLILLPTGLLAATGIWALRRDYVQTQQELRERAQVFGDAAASRLWGELNNVNRPGLDENRWLGFRLDAAGQLVRPAPVPPLEPRPLADDNEIEHVSGSSSIQWGKQIAQLAEPDRSIGWFRLGQRLTLEGHSAAAAEVFRAATNAEARLDSGLPLVPIAAWRAFESALTADRVAAFEKACAAAVRFPSLVTPEILRRATNFTDLESTKILRRWQEEWVYDETCRFLWRSAVRSTTTTPVVDTNGLAGGRLGRAVVLSPMTSSWEELRQVREAAGAAPGNALIWCAKPAALPLLWAMAHGPGDTNGTEYRAYFTWMGPAATAEADEQFAESMPRLSGVLGIWPLPLHSVLKAAQLEPPAG